jgi:flagella basal body P-ring formation protein FlgA
MIKPVTILLLCLWLLPLATFACSHPVTNRNDIETQLLTALPARLDLDADAWVTIARLDIPRGFFENASFCMDIASVSQAQRRVHLTLRDSQEHHLQAVYEVWVKVPALKQPLPRDIRIELSHLTTIDLPWQRLTQDTLRDPAEALGKIAKNTLPAYHALSQRSLKETDMVNKNSPVTIHYRQHNMVLTMEGTALDSGAYGAPIRVINIRTQTVLHAVVDGPGLVKVTRRL